MYVIVTGPSASVDESPAEQPVRASAVAATMPTPASAVVLMVRISFDRGEAWVGDGWMDRAGVRDGTADRGLT
ncbi:hypothetical protein GCM10017608_30580 [Agromyces luteolus]|nr:hypothetical protein GCM10017608_30580 [Agromyces luteolus]